VDDVVLVVGHGRERIEEVVRAAYPDGAIALALQAEQRGTGHAVLCGLEVVPADAEAVLVLYGDVPNLQPDTVRRLVDETRQAGAPVGFVTALLDDPTGYGRVVRDGEGHPVAIVEQKDASLEEQALREINAGLYLFEAGFLRRAVGSLTTDNAQAELYLTDLIAGAAAGGRAAHAVVADEPATLEGVNSRADLARAEAWARQRINERWMREGVTMLDPERTYIEAGVVLARDVTLGPGVMLHGATRIGAGSVLEGGCVVRDSLLGEGVHLLAYSNLEGAEVHAGASVGPFARLRPAAVIGEGAKIGNFVEVKKSVIGRGSKANHLSYLGDATIGEGVNVGAGTITCNYDGKLKHRTVLDDGVFIGSDTQLVAPVHVGRDAYVGAGTTVTRDVPPGALIVTRAETRIIEGYTERKRAAWAAAVPAAPAGSKAGGAK
jgi:bifunctional UDP-N-acetylglucosamine pyrophosphorylase / glucosamine-1-phosphate N-acetyltransferase